MLDRCDPRALTLQRGVDLHPFESGNLPEFFQEKAETELHETSEKIEQCTRQMKDMIKRDRKLSHVDFNDDFILQFLRVRKFGVEAAFHRLRNWFLFMKKNPENMTSFSFEETKRTVTDRIVNVLPWRCHEGCTVLLVELDNWRPDTFSIDALKRMITLTLLQALREPMTQVNGFKVIFDVKSSSLRYLRHCTPHNLYLLYYGGMECCPGRFKGFHVVNDSLTFKTTWLIVKNFLSHKVKERIHFHSSPKTLFDFFPRDCLPIHLGGNLESYDQTTWLKNAMTPEALENMAGGSIKYIATN